MNYDKNYDIKLLNEFSLKILNQIPQENKKIDYKEKYKQELSLYIKSNIDSNSNINYVSSFAISDEKFNQDLFNKKYDTILSEIKELSQNIEKLVKGEVMNEDVPYIDECIRSLVEVLNEKIKDQKYEILKIVEIFRVWILNNIHYNSSYKSNSMRETNEILQDGFDMFYTKIGCCVGCSNLFKIMCDQIDIPF